MTEDSARAALKGQPSHATTQIDVMGIRHFGRITQADVEEMHETLQWLEEFLWNQAVSAA